MNNDKCEICGADEPHTGTCGSDDARALCNRATAASAEPTIDTPEFQRLVEDWRGEPYGARSFENAWGEIVAHIDAALDARAEEARRAVINEYMGEVLAERDSLRAQLAQRTAGGDDKWLKHYAEQIAREAEQHSDEFADIMRDIADEMMGQPVAEAAAQADDEHEKIPELRAYDVIVDRRDVFDFLRAAWRDGQDHGGEMNERERWNRATDHATKVITGWSTMQPVAAPTAQPTLPDDERATAIQRALDVLAGARMPGPQWAIASNILHAALRQPGALPDDYLRQTLNASGLRDYLNGEPIELHPGELRDLLSGFVSWRPLDKAVPTCSVCGSADLKHEASGYQGVAYNCNKCGMPTVITGEEIAARVAAKQAGKEA